VRPDDLRAGVLVSSDVGRHAAWLQDTFGLGVDELYLHQVPRDQDRFIERFGAEVLPQVTAP
jgi:hypothetical protein